MSSVRMFTLAILLDVRISLLVQLRKARGAILLDVRISLLVQLRKARGLSNLMSAASSFKISSIIIINHNAAAGVAIGYGQPNTSF
jgi:hypothetical protein